MRNFYSIIHICPNVATEDSVAIGIIFFNGKKFQTYFSDQKRKIAERLIIKKETDFKSIFNTILKKCDSLNQELQVNKLLYSSEKYTNSSYFEYLNNYSNGLIRFTSPKLFISSNQENEFDKLIDMFFPEKLSIHKNQDTLSQTRKTIQEKLIKRVSDKVHTYYKFEQKAYPSIHFNFELDCIGKNGSLIGAKTFEFDQSEQTLDLKMSHYYSLILMLSSQHQQPIENNHFYLLGKEPSSNSSSEHKLWESAVSNQLITVLDPEESNQVADLIEQKQARMFL